MKILKFGAVWCPGCLVMRPRWEKIEKENDWLNTEYFDIDEFPEVKEKYELKEYPTFIWLDKNEQEIDRRQGEISEDEILDLINKYKEK
ncbi:MAG: thioredoxin family protein [Candidatus Komeilibacteria bacterium]